MNHSTAVTINRAGLAHIAITVTAESRVGGAEQPVRRQMWRGLMVDGTFYPLVLCKHVNANPEALVEATDAALADVQDAIDSLRTPPARSAAEYAERTRDENKARELHPADCGAIDLDAFQAQSPEGRRQVWAAATEADRRGLALQIIRRKNHGPDEETIALYLAELDERFGPTPIERAVCGALERLAESHQRSAETAETREEQTYFKRWAGAFRKAHFAYKRGGIHPEPAESGAWLIPSATRAGRVHSVGRDGRCTCEAQGSGCWHSALVTGIETAGDDMDRFDDGEEEEPVPAVWSTHGELGRRLCAARSRLLGEAA